VRDLIAAHRANRIDGTDRLLALLSFEIWCRIYLDRRSTHDVGDQLAELAA
jgi:asparagine synthase (glutamine-hydrolysing)